MRNFNNLHFPLIFMLSVLFLSPGWTQELEEKRLDLDLEIRPRAEFRNGAFNLRTRQDDPAFFISQRSRLNINYAHDALSVGFSLQNIRVWGASPQVAPSEGSNTMINQAWLTYYFNENINLKIGRQSLVYDDDRILGSLDWHQAGRWHDVALLRYEPDNWKIHAGFGYNQNSERIINNFYEAPGGHYKSLQMFWLGHDLTPFYNFSFLFLNTGFQGNNSGQNFMQTMGGNIYKTGSPLKLTGTFYYQTGYNAADQKVNAFLASIYGNLVLTEKFWLLAGTDYVSGEEPFDPDDDTFTAFDPLYGTHHKFYGYMDYFYVGQPHGGVGLWDKYLGFILNLEENLTFRLVGHAFDAASSVQPSALAEEMDTYLGTELDLSFAWTINEMIKLTGGYSQMLATESMEVLKGGGEAGINQDWAWLMITANPDIY
ncbi:MAG: alginate export family protein [Candidatus Cyclobacteriaceae bacterium M3_2C_046]